MSEKDKFSDILNSYDLQAGEGHCLEDWLDYFHMTISQYFRRCEDSGKRATIAGLKKEIIETAKSDTFKFK